MSPPTPVAEEGAAVKTKKPRAPKKEKGALPTLMGILFVIGLLVAGAIWMIVFAVQQWKGSDSDETAAAPAVTAPAEVSQPVEPDVAPTAPKIAKPTAPAKPAKPEPTPVAAPAKPTPKPTVKPTVKPAPKPDPKRVAAPTKPVAPVKWPALALQGVIGRGQNGSAIVNDQVLAVNEAIEGVRVLSVARQSVELEYEGERRTLKVGMSTR
ncbi:MAG: hypothetical protein ISS31_10465 [Kiritimatiellae bacterium]|nr:hypothetical protein [Kiritimatiellia bacterium]